MSNPNSISSFFQAQPKKPLNRLKRQEPDTRDSKSPVAKKPKTEISPTDFFKSSAGGKAKKPPTPSEKGTQSTKKAPAQPRKPPPAKKQKAPPSDTPSEKLGVFTGMIFVITGEFEAITRDRLTDILKENGAKVTGSVSKRTTYLIYGPTLIDGRSFQEGNKYKKAEQLGTTTMSEKEVEDMLREKVGYGYTDAPGAEPAIDIDAILPVKPSPTPPPPQKATSPAIAKPTLSLPSQAPQSAQASSTAPARSPVVPLVSDLWADKYAPKTFADLIIDLPTRDKVVVWLKDWDDVNLKGHKKETKQGRMGKFDPKFNTNAKAVLLSGPPGIGKTSIARLAAQSFGYRPIELNASDVRNKNAVSNILKVSSGNTALLPTGQVVKNILIMDEVDGMSAGDRGGIAALIEIIKITRIPIICIANDRQSQKLKSLVNYCYDVRFNKPSSNLILKRILGICQTEGVTMDNASIEKMLEASGNDIRQCINLLEMQARMANSISFGTKKDAKDVTKDSQVMLTSFDAAGVLLNPIKRKEYNNKQLMDLYFIDYDLIPLLIFENYLTQHSTDQKTIDNICECADSIAFGDVLNNKVRGDGEWSLLGAMGQASCIHPVKMSGTNVQFVRFPEWFGKFSTERKIKRLLKEIRATMAQNISGNDESVITDYVPAMYQLIMQPLKNEQAEATVETMAEYNLNPMIFKEHIIGLMLNSEAAEEEFKQIPTKVKSALTRLYNNLYKSSISKVKKKKASSGAADLFDPEIEEAPGEESGSESEDEDTVIAKKPAAAKKTPAARKPRAKKK